MPAIDDRILWDLHLSALPFPAITAADELGIFDDLGKAPATAAEVAGRLGLNRRAVRALLPVLASRGLLAQHLGRYYISDTTRNFLLRGSAHYWGPIFALMRQLPMSHVNVMNVLRAPPSATRWDAPSDEKPSDAWSAGEVDAEVAKRIAAYMHANCLPAAVGAAQTLDLSASRRLLDVGAGSGCFSITFAQSNPRLHCTLMDLQGMGTVAMDYVRAAGLEDRVDTCVVDMLRNDWPAGYDSILLSNIFHDWDFETCAVLARKAFQALPPGGRILLHEMLLDDTHDGPPTAVAFSFYMLLGTKGQQFTLAELTELLVDAGFTEVNVTPTHGYFSVVIGTKA